MSESLRVWVDCICRYCSKWFPKKKTSFSLFFFIFFFRWIRYSIHASVTCVIRAPGMVAPPAWAPPVCLPAGCTQGVTSSSQRRQQPTLPSTSILTYTAISPYTTSPTCPDHCCPPSTPRLRSHTARFDTRTCTGNSQFPIESCVGCRCSVAVLLFFQPQGGWLVSKIIILKRGTGAKFHFLLGMSLSTSLTIAYQAMT